MNFAWEMFKLIIILLLVLVVAVYVIRFGLTKLQPAYYQQRGSLQVLERLALNQKSWLFLVQVGDKYLLLGVSTNSIEYLTEVSAEEITSLFKVEKKDFKSYLQKIEDRKAVFSIRNRAADFLRKTADALAKNQVEEDDSDCL